MQAPEQDESSASPQRRSTWWRSVIEFAKNIHAGWKGLVGFLAIGGVVASWLSSYIHPSCAKSDLTQRQIMWCVRNAPEYEKNAFISNYTGMFVVWHGRNASFSPENELEINDSKDTSATAFITDVGLAKRAQGGGGDPLMSCNTTFRDKKELTEYAKRAWNNWENVDVVFTGVIKTLPDDLHGGELNECRIVGKTSVIKANL
jgi:hypothetical protein